MGNQERKKQIKGIQCINCGVPLNDDENFCPNCGQKNDHRRTNIKLFLAEFIDNFVSLDSRLFRTLKLLFIKPDIVPNAYIKGKRKTYISPFKLLIISSLLYFATENFISFVQNFTTDDNPQELTGKNYQKYSYRKTIDSIITTQHLIRFFNSDTISEVKKDSVYHYFLQLKYESEKNTIVKSLSPMIKQTSLERIFYKKNIRYKKFFRAKNIDPLKFEQLNWLKKISFFSNILKDVRLKNIKFDKLVDSVGIKNSKINRYLFNRAKVVVNLENNPNEEQHVEKDAISNISISLFFWLPVFTLLFMIFFTEFNYNYTEFLIIIFYLQSVFFIIMFFYLIIDFWIASNLLIWFFLGAFYIYLWHFIKRFFNQSWGLSFIKALSISAIYSIMSFIGFAIVFYITLLLP